MIKILLGIVVTAIGGAISAGIISVAKRLGNALEDDGDKGDDGPEGGMEVIEW
ncbi:hypothetical protein [Natrinema versiforme]|uniref:hypothetical protein n=1 Tax=Natrinema versiforme TaxID=88724 RepID=UPI0015865625|nr:hypothetical protein [Natrinema versiforme]